MPNGSLEAKVRDSGIARCIECNSAEIIMDEHKELVCQQCGIVLQEGFIDSRGPRVFDSEGKGEIHSERVDPKRPDKGLGSVFFDKKDVHGKPVRDKWSFYRMRKWQSRVLAGEKGAVENYYRLQQYSGQLGLPRNVKDEAIVFFNKSREEHLGKGRSLTNIISAALYHACRICRVPRTVDEICKVTGGKRNSVLDIYIIASRELGVAKPVPEPEDYVQRFCSELKFAGQDVLNKTKDLLKQAREKEILSSKSPVSWCAAAIYVASILCNQRRTQHEIAGKVDITEVTIRNRYHELTQTLGIPTGAWF